MTSVKLPLPSNSEIILNLEVEVETCLGKDKRVNLSRGLGHINYALEDRLKRIPVNL